MAEAALNLFEIPFSDGASSFLSPAANDLMPLSRGGNVVNLMRPSLPMGGEFTHPFAAYESFSMPSVVANDPIAITPPTRLPWTPPSGQAANDLGKAVVQDVGKVAANVAEKATVAEASSIGSRILSNVFLSMRVAASVPFAAVTMYFAHTGSMSANEGIFLKIPGMGALDKNLDLTKFSPEQQKIMRDVSALKDKTKAAPQDQQQSLESEAATKLRQLDELSPAAGRSFRDAAFKSDAPIIPPPSAETPPRVQTEPDHSRAAQNAPAPPTLAQVLAPSEASVVTLPTPATEPMAPPASVAAPQSAVRMAPAPAIEPIAPPSALASPAPRISAPAHPLLAPLAPHKGPYKQLATPPLSESDVLNDASLAITRQRDHVALNGASEQPLLGQRTPENHADAGAYSKRTQGHADANFGNEADANLRDKLVGTTSHTPSAGFVKTASLRPTF